MENKTGSFSLIVHKFQVNQKPECKKWKQMVEKIEWLSLCIMWVGKTFLIMYQNPKATKKMICKFDYWKTKKKRPTPSTKIAK